MFDSGAPQPLCKLDSLPLLKHKKTGPSELPAMGQSMGKFLDLKGGCLFPAAGNENQFELLEDLGASLQDCSGGSSDSTSCLGVGGRWPVYLLLGRATWGGDRGEGWI